ncbi:hypothetical protein [Frankia sp. Cppng1_Ct_nod]|uniref:type IV secretory system conjugative DNA transfer family protein n=1 Tax=Frankia sp. Cppng1_Ct_nod TaxID=2897162 RepID=UPI002024AA27|nr:hypothetical protein [Frankia sp. Cppng1_Ct_nod]
MARTDTTRPHHAGTGRDPGDLLARAAAISDTATATGLLAAATETRRHAREQAAEDAATARARTDPLVQKLLAKAEQAAADGRDQDAARLLAAAHQALDRHPGRVLRIHGQIIPIIVIGVLWAGAAAAHLTPGSGPGLAELSLTVAVACWWAHGRREPAGRRQRRRYTTLIALAGSGWLWWAAATGAGGWRAVVLWAGGYTLTAPHWARRHIPDPPAHSAPEPEPDAAPPPVVVDRRPRTVALWDARVSCPGGVAPGATLTDWNLTPAGQVMETYTVLIPPGEMTRTELQAKATKIASALELGLDECQVDVHPDRREHLARLLVLDRSDAAADMTYPGVAAAFELLHGEATAYTGRYADGELLPWRVFSDDWGAFSGLVLGGTGSGKSRMIELLALTLIESGLVEIWMIDPQFGTSLPVLTDYAPWAATDPTEISLMMQAVDTLGRYRQLENRRHKRSVHPITPHAPMLLLIIDECHEVLPDKNHPHTKIIERLAAMYRKCGLGVLLASQMTELGVFGGSDKIRSNVLRGNAFVMMILSKIGPQLLAGLRGNPAELTLPGQGFRIPATRDVPARSWKPLDLGSDMKTQPALRAAYDALGPSPLRSRLEPGAIQALGATFTDRHSRQSALDTDLFIPSTELWTPPGTPPPTNREPATRTTPTGTTLTAAPWTTVVPLAARDTHQTGSAEAGGYPSLATHAGQQIYALIGDGVGGTGDIREKSGYSKARVHEVLNALAADGLIRQPRHGQWEPTARAA